MLIMRRPTYVWILFFFWWSECWWNNLLLWHGGQGNYGDGCRKRFQNARSMVGGGSLLVVTVCCRWVIDKKNGDGDSIC